MRLESTGRAGTFKVWMTDAELEALRRAAKSHRDDLIIQLGGYVGLRAFEIPQIHPQHIKRTEDGAHYHLRVPEGKDTKNGTYNVIGTADNMKAGRWGHINPNGVDDTFFFRTVTFYATPDREIPTTYLKSHLPNHRADGAAHGDIVQHDGMEYKCMRQAGAAGNPNVPVTALLRYE